VKLGASSLIRKDMIDLLSVVLRMFRRARSRYGLTDAMDFTPYAAPGVKV